jgi:hypothetical protein
MGIGATPADVTTMVNNTSARCGFACHDLDDSDNCYNLAKSFGRKTPKPSRTSFHTKIV